MRFFDACGTLPQAFFAFFKKLPQYLYKSRGRDAGKSGIVNLNMEK